MIATGSLNALVEELNRALADERAAILSGDEEAMNRSTQSKLYAAQRLERETVRGSTRPDRGVLEQLRRKNLENGALLVALQNHVRWVLGYLGHKAVHPTYASDGNKERAWLEARVITTA